MTQSPAVLVTGATGAIGPIVVETFVQAGYRVHTFSRTLPPTDLFPPTVEHFCGEITDPQSLQAAMDGTETVIHLAALLHIVNPLPSLQPLYQQVNVDGTRVVVECAQQVGVKRVVLSSTIAVYGYQRGHLLTEADTPMPDTLYGKSKLAAEEIILQAKQSDGAPLGTVLRLASTYGARVKGNYKRLVQSLARGRFIPIGQGQNRRTLVYEQDVAAALLLTATHPLATGQTFNLSDGTCPTMHEIITTICVALGRTPPPFTLPLGPVKILAGWAEDGARLVGRSSPIGRATVEKYTEDVQVSGELIQRALGFAPQVGLAEGWHRTIAEMRVAGEI